MRPVIYSVTHTVTLWPMDDKDPTLVTTPYQGKSSNRPPRCTLAETGPRSHCRPFFHIYRKLQNSLLNEAPNSKFQKLNSSGGCAEIERERGKLTEVLTNLTPLIGGSRYLPLFFVISQHTFSPFTASLCVCLCPIFRLRGELGILCWWWVDLWIVSLLTLLFHCSFLSIFVLLSVLLHFLGILWMRLQSELFENCEFRSFWIGGVDLGFSGVAW